MAFNQPTVIEIGGSYYAYFFIAGSQKPGLSVARATIGVGGKPGPWFVLTGGKWLQVPMQSGVQTISSADVVVAPPSKLYLTMPWVSFNKYLNAYLMTVVGEHGFYYSTLPPTQGPSKTGVTQADLDRQSWSTLTPFASMPGQNWQKGSPTWENVSFVSPGFQDNHTTDRDGYVLLSGVPGWADKAAGKRGFFIASFSLGASSPPAAPTVTQFSTCRTPNPAPRSGPRSGKCASPRSCCLASGGSWSAGKCT